MNTVKERPILFSGEMVRAILDGRKTQTRRIINKLSGKGKITEFQESDTAGYDFCFRDKRLLWNDVSKEWTLVHCPYGKIGDQLWVRETWQICENKLLIKNEPSKIWEPNPELSIVYRATLPETNPEHPEWGHSRWKSSMFMPRHASRIQLEITNIRVERVQDITIGNVYAEGVCPPGEDLSSSVRSIIGIKNFHDLWDSINAKRGYSWESNPWVWVIEFRRINP